MNKLAARVGACLFLVVTEPAFLHALREPLPATSITVHAFELTAACLSHIFESFKYCTQFLHLGALKKGSDLQASC